MRSPLVIVAALVGAAWAGGPAAAQPVSGVGCEAADFSLSLRLFLPTVADGSGAAAAEGLQGTLEIHHQKVPRELRTWVLDGKRPAQFWNHDGDLRLMLLLGSAEDRFTLVLQAREDMRAGSAYSGSFVLSFGRLKLTGQLACTQG